MAYFDAFHDKTAKNVLSLQQVPLAATAPTVIPANQTGPQDLKAFLDLLFNHPNTGPFICRQLIQHLVTSNPSAGYVYRVAQVFANDGTGVRGNLGAVVRAILTDYEARSPLVTTNVGYGKVKEPLLRATALLRGLNVSAPNGRYLDSYFYPYPETLPDIYGPQSIIANAVPNFGQAPLSAPSVFNFFTPTYVVPGAIASSGLVAPEMQITDASFSILVPNALSGFLFRVPPSTGVVQAPSSPFFTTPPTPWPFLVMDYSELLPLVPTPSALLDRLSLLFCGGALSTATRTRILDGLQSLVPATTNDEKMKTAIWLVIASPDGAVQK